jgi:hypothetical protein
MRQGLISLLGTWWRSSQDELEACRRDLSEALEQQAATTEILRVIRSSPTDIQLVLEVVVESAARFCQADDVTIFELDGQDLRSAAHWGAVPQDIGVRFPCSRGHVAGRTVLEGRAIHVVDLQAEAEEFPEGISRPSPKTRGGSPSSWHAHRQRLPSVSREQVSRRSVGSNRFTQAVHGLDPAFPKTG